MLKKTAQLIDGRALAEKIILELQGKIAQLSRPPGLAVILIGDDPASHLYVRNKKRASQKVGIIFHEYLCDEKCFKDIAEKEILEMINWLNEDKEIDGIIVQLPLPKKFNTEKIINSINPNKDVDGFHPENIKKFSNFSDYVTSPLIEAIRTALNSTGQNLLDKETVIVGKNPILYNHLTKALKNDGLKITNIAANDKDLGRKTKTADILIVIAGKRGFIKKSMVKPNAIVIDVGTNLIGENKWAGDVDPNVAKVASFLTPVPGGIGPLTVAMLLKNTFQLAEKNQ